MNSRRSTAMKISVPMLSALCALFVSGAHAQSVPMQTMSGLLRLVQTSPLPTEGYMDHLTVDVKGQRLLLCGEAKKSLIVIEMRTGKITPATKGVGGTPRKPFFIPETNEVWTDLGGNTVVSI